MDALVVYDSQYGNTERIAQVIADTLGEFGAARAVGLDPGQGVELGGVGMFIVGCPTQGWKPTPTIQSFLEEVSSEELRSLAVACFDTPLPATPLDDWFCCQSDGQDAAREGRLASLAAGEFLREGYGRSSAGWRTRSCSCVGADAHQRGAVA